MIRLMITAECSRSIHGSKAFADCTNLVNVSEPFITEPVKLPEAVSEFEEALRGNPVDDVPVGKDKALVFTLISGSEMKA